MIEKTIPVDAVEWHRQLWNLARRLKGIPSLASAEAEDLDWIVRKWLKLAAPALGKPVTFDEANLDFLQCWDDVRQPAGSGTLDQAYRRAVEADPPACVQSCESEAPRMLATICRELQRSAGDKPFFLGCRDAADLIGVHKTAAARWMKYLVRLRVLKLVDGGDGDRVVKKGIRSVRMASEYRYIGD